MRDVTAHHRLYEHDPYTKLILISPVSPFRLLNDTVLLVRFLTII